MLIKELQPSDKEIIKQFVSQIPETYIHSLPFMVFRGTGWWGRGIRGLFDGNTMVGIMLSDFAKTKNTINLYHIAILPKYRNNGLSKLLLAMLLLTHPSAATIKLKTPVAAKTIHRFWKHLGFTENGKTDNCILFVATPVDVLLRLT